MRCGRERCAHASASATSYRLVIARCGGTLSAMVCSPCDNAGTLVVANWGGDLNDRTVKFVEAPLVESKGYHIDHVLTLEPERKPS